ncbi:non-specific serine/threonine protein kinase/serine/threonine-protein kinase [Sphingomonas naasensis]|uniref:Serine/threonine protein kinase n=1 Tax=Sphingomonas naasensis TaxID=1344951 RepID=A0A4S1W7B7_9SPHN|nr:serine/threonine-protein kinase [Sphingomonas naasensis]NIJ20681.1 non-specific serine/threonine protein kinase/serine/threonine-protein kinase [Sphingomonas naasensis]TGX37595.1 serine/threonine protein kinase [Sphingomonas naasensis]
MKPSETEAWAAVAEAFDAIEPLDSDAREAALARVEPDVAQRVRALLRSSEQVGILDALPEAPPAADPEGLARGTRIGAFAIDRLIGRGGMGEVYLAHRSDAAFEQRVAIKLLRLDAAPNAALFDRERSVLARLEHSGIAHLIDGGRTDDGRPWMAMAYVEGLPIDAWCAEHQASLAERLRLFRDVCDAVSFAHANLVVHRDLKPSNILVDANGRVHLLDFGIAKLIDAGGGTDTLQTTALMTPDYAAPEQLANEPVTVATDVHALGLVLYQLLTGATPWGGTGGSLPTLVRRMLSEEPAAPSRMAPPQAPVSAGRLRGDLDAIVLKAMRRQPADRYVSVEAMAEDLRRYEAAQPVRARVGSRRYRLGRYLRRHWIAVAGVTAVFVALLLGAGGIALQARRTAVQRDAALAEAKRADSIVQTLTLMFAQGGYSNDLTLKQTLDESALRMLATLDRSSRSGSAVNALVDLYVNLGDGKGGYALAKDALARGIGADDPILTARLKIRLADTAVAIGAGEEAPPLLDEAAKVFAADPERNAADIQDALATRAAIARRARDYDTAVGLLTANLDAAERAYAGNDSALLARYNNLLVYLIEANRLAEFEKVFARVDRALAQPGRRDLIQSLGIEQLRGAWALRKGDVARAEQIATDVSARRRRLFGQTPGLATDLAQLAKTQIAGNRFAEARVSLAEARPMAVRFLGERSIPVIVLDLAEAQTLAELGEAAGAQAALGRARATLAAMPPANPLAPQLALTEAVVALKQGDKVAAQAAVARGIAGFTAMGPAGAYGLQAIKRIEARVRALPARAE